MVAGIVINDFAQKAIRETTLREVRSQQSTLGLTEEM